MRLLVVGSGHTGGAAQATLVERGYKGRIYQPTRGQQRFPARRGQNVEGAVCDRTYWFRLNCPTAIEQESSAPIIKLTKRVRGSAATPPSGAHTWMRVYAAAGRPEALKKAKPGTAIPRRLARGPGNVKDLAATHGYQLFAPPITRAGRTRRGDGAGRERRMEAVA